MASQMLKLSFESIPENVYLIVLGVFTLIATIIIIHLIIKQFKSSNPELNSYIKKSAALGRDRGTIRDALTGAGWPSKTVDSELSRFFK